MTRLGKRVCGHGFFYTSIICSVIAGPVFAQEGEPVAAPTGEEIVVTGSYLKRSTADSSTPLAVIDRTELDKIAPNDVKDIVRTMTYNSGSISTANVFDGGDSAAGNASINLRNLGNGSTLVLVNGKRVVLADYDLAGNGYVNIEGLMPTIAVERVETVKDGSSALYGSDAVAGVVNFLTRRDFEGFEMNARYQTDDQTEKQDDRMFEMILGIQSDRGGMVLSGSHLQRDGLQIGDRFEDYGRSGLSTNGQPGRARPANPAAVVDLNGAPALYGPQADLDCNATVRPDFKGSQGTLGPNLCVYDFSSFFNIVEEGEVTKIAVTADYQLSDQVSVYVDSFFSDNYYERGNSLFPATIPPTIPATNLGLVNDAARRGIQPTPLIMNFRLMGGANDTPFALRPVDTATTADADFLRYTGGVRTDLELFGRDWTLDLSYTHSQRKLSANTRSDTATQATLLAFEGLGGVGCDPLTGVPGSGNAGTGNCFFLNPFASAYITPTGAPQTDPNLINPPELLNALVADLTAIDRKEMDATDLVFAGDLLELPAGTMGLAVGGQLRRERAEFDRDDLANNFDLNFNFGESDWQGDFSTSSLFAEVRVPILDNLEVNAAIRYEDFDDYDTDSTDPKVSVLYRPFESLSLRGSWGSSYRVASLLQGFGRESTLLNTADPLGGGSSLFIPALSQGNPELSPESADAYNVGFSWAPVDGMLDGLSIDLDYYNYDYQDIITRQNPVVLIGQDAASRCPQGANNNPLDAVPDCGFQLDGSFISVGPGDPQVVRGIDGTLLRTNSLYENAQSLETSGVDLAVAWSIDTDFGTFRPNGTVSYTLEYDLIDTAGNQIDGVGSRNENNSVGHPLPEYKARGGLDWYWERHAASFVVNYIDEFEDDTAGGGLFNFLAIYIGAHPVIDSMTTYDVQYTYTLPDFGFGTEGSTLTVGVVNATDEVPPPETKNGLFDPFTHDPRGRMVYGSVKIVL